MKNWFSWENFIYTFKCYFFVCCKKNVISLGDTWWWFYMSSISANITQDNKKWEGRGNHIFRLKLISYASYKGNLDDNCL